LSFSFSGLFSSLHLAFESDKGTGEATARNYRRTQGESLDKVALIAGHKNLNITARYARPSRVDLEAAGEKIAAERGNMKCR